MPKMLRKKALLYGTAALVTTLLCFSVVHNAAIRDASQRARSLQNDLQGADKLPQDLNIKSELVKNDAVEKVVEKQVVIKEEHVFNGDSVDVPANLNAPPRDKIQSHDAKLHDSSDIKNVKDNENNDKQSDLKADNVIKSENNVDKIQDQMNGRGGGDGQENAALRFESEETDDEKVPQEQIFGVGERVINDPKPLPVVKAPKQINAFIDARPKEEEEKFVAEDQLELDDLQPPDHLDAVRMEQDGHINRNYQREVFFGEHEGYENLSEDEMAKKLKEIFVKVDTSKNGFITVDELEDWIVQKTNEHFTEAEKENAEIFKSLDSDSDGYINWEEFEIQFLIALGNKEQDARLYARGKEEDIPLDIEDRERLVRYKFKWSEAEQEPVDNRLNEQEFQAFRHPESSRAMLQQMVEDILDNLDRNKDGIVTEKEFIALPPGEYEYSEVDTNWQKQRTREFRNVIDLDHNGKVTKLELLNYVDPQNPNHAKMEARNLLELGDSNGDDRLSLNEIIDNMDLFYGSKMVNTGLSFHDEF